jgi:cobalt-zinc-cadmium efflux system membrane fusion protein
MPRTPAITFARRGRLVIGGLLGCVGAAALVVGVIMFEQHRAARAGTPAAAATPAAAKPVRTGPNSLEIPADVVKSLDVHTAVAVAATRPRPLAPFPGILNLDIDLSARVHTRFAGEIVALGVPNNGETTDLPQPGSSAPKPLSVGDSVHKGQLLAVVWSKDLGEKKSELIDGLVKLKSDQKSLKELESLYARGGTSERVLRDAEVAVQGDVNAVAKATRTLQSWRLTDAEIATVRAEADRIIQSGAHDTDDRAWARVEVRAPLDGVILEKNVNFGDVVDTTADLFKVADRTRLTVIAHVFEEDLVRLQDPHLPKPLPWTVRVPAMPGVTFPGHLERFGDIIDPNQHTALAIGHVENADGRLKVGQTVTATVELPPAGDEVEIQSTALVEDGRESVVFVQPVADKQMFVQKHVDVVRRLQDVAVVKAGAIRPGDRVVTGGAVFLKDALPDLPEAQSR